MNLHHLLIAEAPAQILLRDWNSVAVGTQGYSVDVGSRVGTETGVEVTGDTVSASDPEKKIKEKNHRGGDWLKP